MRWGLIGASTIAKEWMIDAIRAHAANEIVAVLSSSAERGQHYAETHRIPASYVDLGAMLARERLDAVYISTTNELHEAQCLAAAAAGCHVLCEKPLALDRLTAERMVRACREAQVIMGTNHHLRHAATHRSMRALIAAGELGRVLSARVFHAVYLPEHLQGWRLDRPDAGGGVILDITVHNADTVAFLLGEYPQRVTAFEQRAGLSPSLEDGCMSVWECPSGVQVFSHEAFTLPFARTGIEIHGDQGSLYAQDVMTQQPIGTIQLVTRAGTRHIEVTPQNLYEDIVRNFLAAIRGEEAVAASGEDGVRSLAVALAVRESARTGKATDVDYGAHAPQT
jgi:1,5-anhydro-D-fructose reductase (1,5-anhydro-D-mannitol-forming)